VKKQSLRFGSTVDRGRGGLRNGKGVVRDGVEKKREGWREETRRAERRAGKVPKGWRESWALGCDDKSRVDDKSESSLRTDCNIS